MAKKIGDALPSSLSSTLNNSLLWSATEAIINARDPIQNPDQTRIFSYKPGQTRLTRTKRDLVDPDDPTQFQPWSGSNLSGTVYSALHIFANA